MKRDLNRLASQNFDLVVIGGGIQGAAVALEAAHCGLQTALVEKGDFGHATSANSLKILHGGFRYLQSLDLHRMRSSIWSRNFFMRLAPHLVQPLPCVIPTHGCGLRGKYPMGLGLLLNDMIAWDRNVGLDHDKRLPLGKLISLQKCSREMPEVSVSGKSGGAVWYDALAVDTERMTLAVVKEAAGLGVCAANYCRATELRIARNRINGLWAQDVLSGQSFPVFSSVIIDATGPWLQHSLLPKAQARQHISWARGVNIVVRKRLSASMAMGLEGDSVNGHHSRGRGGKKKRFFFFVPWGGYTMVGTVYTRHDGPPEKMTVSRHELQSMIDEIRSIHPGSGLKYEDISFYHAGLLPMDSGVVSNNGISLHQSNSLAL
ncbi:FAD-dependent oxidoreductase [Desulfovermiculus halophilus]|uniref:FAD-dependent oxidoreductase n=1 Tax=Desulfovermiculus halophilus TaxID=339722 RepID=UPI0006880CEC|nr:FAD-dependent oxidoreductase [Desulfovermiculus halophilus]